MFKHARQLGELHKKKVNKNPNLKKKFDRSYDRFVEKLRINPPKDQGDKPSALLQQKYQYPKEFIDPATGRPYYLYQFCPIAVYWSVDIVAGFKYLFARQKIEDLNVYFWIPKYNWKIWHETDWTTAEKTQANLHWEQIEFVTPDGQEKRYKRPPRLVNRYLTYNIDASRPNGQNLKMKRLATEDVYEAYAKWFVKNKDQLSGQNPVLTFDAKDTIKPIYRQIEMKGVEYSVMDPVWNLGITIRALYAFNQLRKRKFQTYPINVQNIKQNKFFKTYITDINKHLPDDGKINFDAQVEIIKTADATMRESIKTIKLKSVPTDGVFAPFRLTHEYLIRTSGNTQIKPALIPKEIKKKNQRKTTLEKFIQSYKDIPYYLEYTITEGPEDNQFSIKNLEYPDGTPIEAKDLVGYLNPQNQWTEIANLLKQSPNTLLKNNIYVILNDGVAYYPISTSNLPYRRDNLNKIFQTMKQNYEKASRKELN